MRIFESDLPRPAQTQVCSIRGNTTKLKYDTRIGTHSATTLKLPQNAASVAGSHKSFDPSGCGVLSNGVLAYWSDFNFIAANKFSARSKTVACPDAAVGRIDATSPISAATCGASNPPCLGDREVSFLLAHICEESLSVDSGNALDKETAHALVTAAGRKMHRGP